MKYIENEFVDYGKVRIQLTNDEYLNYMESFEKAVRLGGCPADYMSGKVEEIVTGYAPERYTKLDGTAISLITKSGYSTDGSYLKWKTIWR